MRKNWSDTEDTSLRRIVGLRGLEDWTAVAQELRQRCESSLRTGKQCRERWYNHLSPEVNKKAWSYEESAVLFQAHRLLGNKWKEISLRLRGRTDNNIKNHFYSTLRRSLRRLNKLLGEKNATHQMREIKPSILTIILKFIYDNQELNENNTGELIEELRGLPKLIFEFAEFKPVKGNIREALKEINQHKIETIFNLVEQFKECYIDQKADGRRFEVKEEEEGDGESASDSPHYNHTITLSEFRPMEKTNVLINTSKESDPLPATSTKEQSCRKDGNSGESQMEGQEMMEVHEPSPISSLLQLNPSQLVVVGKHWSPKREEVEVHEGIVDEVLEINYE